MRLKLLRLLTVPITIGSCFILLSGNLKAQHNFPTYQFGTTCTPLSQSVYNLACNQVCLDIKYQVPHFKQSSDYIVSPVCYNPFPYTTPGGIEDPNIYNDDKYSFVVNSPFPFCFYDSLFNAFVVGSNGLITFELGNANCSQAAWNVILPLPNNSGLNTPPCTSSTTSYPKAAIMAIFEDLDPRPGPSFPGIFSSPSDRKIEWRVEGTAPARRMVISYYHIGVYQITACGVDPNQAAIFQIVIYESTGLIDIYIQRKICDPITESSAIIGIHDWTRLQWKAVPGRNATSGWTANNEGWRFTPSAATSRFVSAEMLDMSANVVATADTTTTVAGLLDVTFPSFCTPPGSNQFVVRTKFSSCDNPLVQLTSLDTITTNRTNSLNATATTTNASCGPPNGTITVTIPFGIGTPPYTYVLDGGAPVTAPSPYTFTNVAAGPHIITVTDASAGCNSTINVTVNLSGNIPATTSANATSCAGVNNGSITITSAGGTGPYTFSLDGAPAVAGTIPYTFTNLSAGNHTILVNDLGLGCSSVLMTVNVPVGIGITGSVNTTPTTCPGASNGTVTATALSGVPPFTWQLDAGPIVPGASPYTFTNVTAGAHIVRITDNLGCIGGFNANVAPGPGINGSTTSTATTCPAASNGTITATALSGTAPFTWSLDGAPPVAGASPYTFINVAAGLHTVTIIDNMGCNTVMTETVAAGPGINGSTTSTATSCPAVSNGTITATALSGTAPFTWSLDGGAPVAGASPHTFINVAAGVHTVTITDNVGCTALLTETVAAGAGNTGNANSTPTSCPAVSNGTITATALTGTAPFTWQLDGGAIVPGASPYTFTNVAAGLHTVTITDNVGCNVLISVTVNAGAGNTGSANSTPTSCPAVSNGTITATALTGTAPFTWQLDGGAIVPGASPYTFTNVAAGLHTVTITDNAGCNVLISVTVNAGAGNTGSANSTPTSCPAVSNGTVTATALTGTAPFTWSLDGGAPVPGASPYTFTNVAAGPHTVTINDNVGCSVVVNVTVNAGAGNTGSATSTPTSCPAVSNGTITATALTGTAPFTWQLDGGAIVPGVSPYTFINVAAGAHTVTINDNVGCSVTVNVTVNAGAGITANLTSTATACAGVPNGTITADATSGTAPFTYSLDGGVPQSGANPYTFINVPSGVHTITVTDNVGCSYTNTVTVPVGAGVSGTASSTPTSCPSALNGTITADATAGTPPFTWKLDAGGAVPGATPHTFTNVAAGAHTVTITDNFGCSTTINVTVTAGPPLTATTSTTSAECPTATNGTITISTATGSSPYTFSLDGGVPVAGTIPFTFINVSPGIHTVVVTDAIGCNTAPISVTVAIGSGVSATATTTGTTCPTSATGTITVTVTAGYSPFTYSLDGGPPQNWPNPSFIFNGVTAGTHTVVITDIYGCTFTLNNIVVPAGPPLTTTVTTTDVLCHGGSTGIITVTPPAGPLCQYSLDNINWQWSNIFNGLAAGTYTVYYRLASLVCQGSQVVTINEPPVLAATNSTIPAVCNGQPNGTITINANGGVSPYQYSIDAGATWQAGNVFTVAAGNYTIIIRDANNCTKTQNATVTEPAILTASSVNGNASCDGGNDGVITVNAAGGNSGYTYSIDGVNFQPSNVFNVAPGPYTVTVKDNLGCTALFNTVVGMTNNLTLTPQTDPTICEGTSTQLQLISNATGYSWTPAAGLSNPNISNPVANPTVTTQYTVTATLGRCSANDIVIVNVNPAPIPDAGPPGVICYGQTYQLQGSGGVQYTWTPSTYLSSTTIANPVSTPLKTITYTLSQVIDAIGCKSLTTDQVTVDVTPPIKVKTFPFDTIGYPGDQFRLNATSAATNYSWTPATGLSNPNIPDPILTVGPVGSDVVYQVIASTAAGCRGEGYVRVKVYNGPELYVPSAFTPNGDGLNETFYPFPVGIKAINYFKVFNRWGQLLFSSTTLFKGWDGKLQGVEQPNGVYVFMAQGVDKNGKLLTRQGTVTLIR